MILLDSDVLVDVIRGQESARQWLSEHASVSSSIAGFAMFEILQSCNSRAEQERVRRILAPFTLRWPSDGAMELALTQFERLRLSHGVGIFDCLIAQTAIEHGMPLYSFNVRHFSLFTDLEVRQPYAR